MELIASNPSTAILKLRYEQLDAGFNITTTAFEYDKIKNHLEHISQTDLDQLADDFSETYKFLVLENLPTEADV